MTLEQAFDFNRATARERCIFLYADASRMLVESTCTRHQGGLCEMTCYFEHPCPLSPPDFKVCGMKIHFRGENIFFYYMFNKKFLSATKFRGTTKNVESLSPNAPMGPSDPKRW